MNRQTESCFGYSLKTHRLDSVHRGCYGRPLVATVTCWTSFRGQHWRRRWAPSPRELRVARTADGRPECSAWMYRERERDGSQTGRGRTWRRTRGLGRGLSEHSQDGWVGAALAGLGVAQHLVSGHFPFVEGEAAFLWAGPAQTCKHTTEHESTPAHTSLFLLFLTSPLC